MSMLGFVLNSNSFVVNVDGKVYSVDDSHPRYKVLRDCLKTGDTETFLNSVNVKNYVENSLDSTKTGLVLDDVGNVTYKGKPLHNTVVDAIRNMISEGFDVSHMVKFLENLLKNPSKRSVDELYNFLTKMGLVITEDGCFLAYKTVRSNYMDKYSGTICNEVGSVIPRFDRNEVDDDCNRVCSYGYHVGALDYAGPGGWYNGSNDKVMICKVNPADVVSVPVDHSFSKLRCCYYEVVSEYQGELKSSVYSGEVGDDYSDDEDPDFDYIEVDDMYEGEYYTCAYTSANGQTKKRYFIMDHYDNDRVTVELVYPEEHEGEFRSFRLDKIEDLAEWDGECIENLW